MIPSLRKTNLHTMTNPTANREIEITARNYINPGARILIVDDDAAIRELGAAILILEGYRVEVAEDGAEALALTGERTFRSRFHRPPDANSRWGGAGARTALSRDSDSGNNDFRFAGAIATLRRGGTGNFRFLAKTNPRRGNARGNLCCASSN